VNRHRRNGRGALPAALGCATLAVSICLSLSACGTVTVNGSSAPGRCPQGQIAAAPQVCLAAGDPRAQEILSIMESAQRRYSQKAMLFGVWDNGRVIATGALGTSYPLVPATANMHFRIGNITESMTCTLLLELVDRGKISLNDPVSKWLPSLPYGNRVTVGMLAQSTSGYASFYTDQWDKQFDNDPFQTWTPDEMIRIGTSQPLTFSPGTSWKFSDTNYTILGQVLVKAGGAPLQTQIQRLILDPLQLTNTQMTPSSYIPSPVLHGYDSERGDYQDSTFWSISWATNIGDMTSNLSDLGRWATALGTGELLTPKSYARQFAPVTVGLGPFTSKKLYAAMGAVVANGWIVCNPNVPGYWDALGYLPSKKLAVVISSVPNSNAPPNVHYAVAAFNKVAAMLDPSSPPNLRTG
jgi:D-alanyl-D-alanine carboxypeptidase